jgi:hypothetical protein
VAGRVLRHTWRFAAPGAGREIYEAHITVELPQELCHPSDNVGAVSPKPQGRKPPSCDDHRLHWSNLHVVTECAKIWSGSTKPISRVCQRDILTKPVRKVAGEYKV